MLREFLDHPGEIAVCVRGIRVVKPAVLLKSVGLPALGGYDKLGNHRSVAKAIWADNQWQDKKSLSILRGSPKQCQPIYPEVS